VKNGRFGKPRAPMGWRAPSKQHATMQGGDANFGRKLQEATVCRLCYARRMAYSISGLDPAPFAHLIGLPDAKLAAFGAVRMIADANPGFPCRVTLDDAALGEALLLINHVSHGGDNPYCASHAIFVGEGAQQAACFRNRIPPALDRRVLSLRGFDSAGMMRDAALVQPGGGDVALRTMLADPVIDHIDAHNAVRGCFAARVERA
jgi:Protein of unknown function (DUF1203)